MNLCRNLRFGARKVYGTFILLDAAGVAIGRHSKTGTICVIDLIKTAR